MTHVMTVNQIASETPKIRVEYMRAQSRGKKSTLLSTFDTYDARMEQVEHMSVIDFHGQFICLAANIKDDTVTKNLADALFNSHEDFFYKAEELRRINATVIANQILSLAAKMEEDYVTIPGVSTGRGGTGPPTRIPRSVAIQLGLA